jgi:hypothetical protein
MYGKSSSRKGRYQCPDSGILCPFNGPINDTTEWINGTLSGFPEVWNFEDNLKIIHFYEKIISGSFSMAVSGHHGVAFRGAPITRQWTDQITRRIGGRIAYDIWTASCQSCARQGHHFGGHIHAG